MTSAIDSSFRRLGRTAVMMPTFGLGGGTLGNLYRPLADEDATAIVHAALDLGVRYFDTAPFYGFGLSERRIGAALAAREAKPILSTKVGRLLEPTDDTSVPRHGFYSREPYEPRFDYSYDAVLRSHESSLARLRVDRVDVLLCHDIGAHTHGERNEAFVRQFLEGGYRALRKLRDEGAIRAIGLGVNECEICERLLVECDLDCLLLAGRYTLLEQPALASLMPMCAERGVSVIVGGPFNSGILAAAANAKEQHYDYQRAPTTIVERVQRIADVCREFSTPVGAAALQFPLAAPQVACVIPGCSSVAEIRQADEWMRHPIPNALWLALRSEGLIDQRAPIPS
jgi:D-threo-aldose 1-dehydrogenase